MTLTEMLGKAQQQVNDIMQAGEAPAHQYEEMLLESFKETFKEWLRTVGLPNFQSYGKGGVPISATESLRKLLMILVDEPSSKETKP